jgi:DNA polymerase-3 subunit alpha
LVCYALGITDLDPIEHDLMFERFLDPNRTELPDIDVDFQDVDATKDLLRRIFGEQNVACLSSYGTFQIKGLLKDLGRVFDVDHNEINKVNKKIESELRVLYVNQDKSTIVIKLDDIQRVSKTFNEFVEKYPQVGKHLTKLYGRNRHVGRHAAGVIIGDNLPAETAVFTSKGVVQASFTEGIVNKNISAMGFVKFDILSIATLKVVDFALRLIAQNTGKSYEELRESIRPHRMNLNDEKVLKHVFWNGNFAGIFQFTEKGIRRLAQKVKPDTFIDVSAITSIYRPGPLGGGFDKLFVHNKHNPDDVKYDHPLLESILKKTRGCIVFQEQLMQICNVLGKMSMKDVNRVRKVLLKKDKSKSEEFLKKENDELSGKFFNGCEENGMNRDSSKELWDKLLKFGGYGFNKAHSDAYTVLTMQTAYLATYYPLEFYSALLTKGQSGELQDYVSDIKRCGIKILSVDVNESKGYHKIEGTDAIRLSFNSVNGLGPSAIEKIVKNQPYTDFLNFLEKSGSSKTAVQPLLMVGTFDRFPHCSNMKALEKFYTAYMENPKLKQKKNKEVVDNLFRTTVAENTEKDYGLDEKVFFENSLIGFSIRGSPFEILGRKEKLEQMSDSLVTYKDFVEGEQDLAMIPVVVKEVRERAQRNGQMMAFVKFGVETGEEFDVPCFSSIWKWIGSKTRKGFVYLGTFNKPEGDASNLMIGKPGFAHSMNSAMGYLINLDEVQI